MTEQFAESQPEPVESIDSLRHQWRVANMKWLAVTNLGENVDTPEAVAWAEKANKLGNKVVRLQNEHHQDA